MRPVADDIAGDRRLVRLAREGYLDAFEELLRRHQVRAYTVAVRLLGDRHDAQDVVQEAFVDAWKGLPKFSEDAAFGTWLHRIVVNRALALASARRRRPQPVAEVPDWPDARQGPEGVVESRAQGVALHRAIQGLPIDLRTALVLVTFGGFSYGEAAVMLDTTASTVRGRVARARRTLLYQMRGWA